MHVNPQNFRDHHFCYCDSSHRIKTGFNRKFQVNDRNPPEEGLSLFSAQCVLRGRDLPPLLETAPSSPGPLPRLVLWEAKDSKLRSPGPGSAHRLSSSSQAARLPQGRDYPTGARQSSAFLGLSPAFCLGPQASQRYPGLNPRLPPQTHIHWDPPQGTLFGNRVFADDYRFDRMMTKVMVHEHRSL